jgi:hypothetical protein
LQTSPKSAYHFPVGPSHGFPVLHPDYVPFVPTLGNVEIDREHEENAELEGDE